MKVRRQVGSRIPLHGALALVHFALLLSGSVYAQESEAVAPRLALGVFDGPAEFTFGRIRDVALGPDGTIFVLDSYAQEVRSFGSDGVFLATVGKAGQGPGEFADAYSVTVDDDGNLLVLDPGNQRVTAFTSGLEGYDVSRDFRLEGFARDVCVLGDRIFLLTSRDASIVTEVDGHGQGLRSFGAPVAPDADLRSVIGPGPHAILSHGHIVCDADTDRVYYVSEMLPVVRAYTSDGNLIWTNRLDDFVRVELSLAQTPSGGRCCRFSADPETGLVHTVVGVALGDEGLVVTLNLTRPAEDLEGVYEIRVLNIEDGREIKRSQAQMQFAGFYDHRPYGFTQVPFPRVFVF